MGRTSKIPRFGIWYLGYSNDHTISKGLLSNSVRNNETARGYIFDKLAEFRAAGYYHISAYEKSPVEYDAWFKNKLSGFIQNRIYNGTMSGSDVEQCFHYTYERNSWAFHEHHNSLKWNVICYPTNEKLQMDTFTSSSYACEYLCVMMCGYRNQRRSLLKK